MLPVPEGCVVRAYQPGDLPALCALLTRAFGETEPWDEGRVRRTLIEADDVEETYVVAEGDRLLATASARGDAGLAVTARHAFTSSMSVTFAVSAFGVLAAAIVATLVMRDSKPAAAPQAPVTQAPATEAPAQVPA